MFASLLPGPSGQEVIPSLRDQGDGNIGVEWTASEVGDHRIEIKYHGLQIQNSPSTARAWDASRVVVSGIKAGRIAKPYNFNSKRSIYRLFRQMRIYFQRIFVNFNINLNLNHQLCNLEILWVAYQLILFVSFYSRRK